jgi:hypothetical protein
MGYSVSGETKYQLSKIKLIKLLSLELLTIQEFNKILDILASIYDVKNNVVKSNAKDCQ